MRRLLPVISAALLAGCFYPADRGKALETRLDKLGADNAQLTRELAETRAKLAATVPKIDEKIAEVAKAMESLDKAAHRSEADIGIQFQKTVEDLAKLRGQVETYLFKIGELESALKKQGEDTDARFTLLQGAEAVKAAEAKKKADELKRPEDKKDFFQLAEDKAKAGELSLARQLYADFLKKWPKDELTGEAHYGLGETFFSEDKCREALFEYGKVIQDFGKAKSAPVAYLRSADCFKKLKMNDESRLALEELVRQYPKSDPAKTAKTRLAELDKAKKPPAPAPKKGKK
ncbi:MAG: tetratricopeptide repeat protein [Myxococcaceae bacterium]